MYTSALDYWYKKRHDNWENKSYFNLLNDKIYTSKQLKFGMRIYLFFGIFLGIFMGYLIFG